MRRAAGQCFTGQWRHKLWNAHTNVFSCVQTDPNSKTANKLVAHSVNMPEVRSVCCCATG
jgi:hypothetical protein